MCDDDDDAIIVLTARAVIMSCSTALVRRVVPRISNCVNRVFVKDNFLVDERCIAIVFFVCNMMISTCTYILVMMMI